MRKTQAVHWVLIPSDEGRGIAWPSTPGTMAFVEIRRQKHHPKERVRDGIVRKINHSLKDHEWGYLSTSETTRGVLDVQWCHVMQPSHARDLLEVRGAKDWL